MRFSLAAFLRMISGIAGCVMVLGCTLVPAASGSVFEVSAAGFVGQTSSGPVGIGNRGPNSAFAGVSGTNGVASASFSPATNTLSNNFLASGSLAKSSLDDIVFSGPGATVQTRVTIPFDALLLLSVDELVGFKGLVVKGSAAVDVTSSASMFCGNSCGFNETLNVHWDAPDPFVPIVNNASPGIVYSLDFLGETVQLLKTEEILGDNYVGSNVQQIYFLHGYFDSGRTTVPVGVPILMNFLIASGAQTQSFFVSSAHAVVDGRNTMGFPIGVPVFDLPSGFTVNAPSIGLVNNVIPGDIVPGPSGVPEPSSLLLLVVGLGGLAFIRLARAR